MIIICCYIPIFDIMRYFLFFRCFSINYGGRFCIKECKKKKEKKLYEKEIVWMSIYLLIEIQFCKTYMEILCVISVTSVFITWIKIKILLEYIKNLKSLFEYVIFTPLFLLLIVCNSISNHTWLCETLKISLTIV